MNKILIAFIFGVFVVGMVQDAYMQIPTQQYIQRLEAEGKMNCEIQQFNEFFYKPIRINMVHERVADHQVSIQSGDPASEVFWEGSFQTFQLVTDSPDRFDIEIILDYEVKHEEPRQVYYQIYGLDNVLMQEGNYVHEGFTFCLVYSFSTTDPPHILTSEEIQEENNKFNADFRKEVALSNTTIQSALLLYGIVIMVIGIIVGIVFFIIVVSLRGMGKIGNKPVKKLNDMIENVRTLQDNLKLVTDHMIQTDVRSREDVKSEINKALADTSIVMHGAKQILEKLAKATGTKIVLESPPVEVKTQPKKDMTSKQPSITEIVVPKTAKEQKEIEDDYAKHYGVTSEPKLPEAQTEEFDADEIKPCKICGQPPQNICGECGDFFCNDHIHHGCDVKEMKPKEPEKPLQEKVGIVTKTLKTAFFDEKDPTIVEEGMIQKYLDNGVTQLKITSMLIKEYEKNPRNENLRIYADLQKKAKKKHDIEIDIKIGAMLTTLNRQVQ